MSEQVFEALLKRMGDIASAVNSFTSEAVQVEAFAALLRALRDDAGAESRNETGHKRADNPSSMSVRSTDESKTRRRRREGGAEFKVIKDLNLRPQGKLSFEHFIAQKQPKTNEERYVVAVYYLEQILGLSAITIDHVGTLFRLTSAWREPSSLGSGLRMTALRKGTIDTGDQNRIKTTPQGRNFVEHDLPHKSVSK